MFTHLWILHWARRAGIARVELYSLPQERIEPPPPVELVAGALSPCFKKTSALLGTPPNPLPQADGPHLSLPAAASPVPM